MILEVIKHNKALHPAYFKQNLKLDDINLFETNFKRLFERIDENESEEHNKNILSDFLKNSFYKNDYEINTSGRKDLVIHKDSSNQSPVAVIIEVKKPVKKACNSSPEMISFDKPNVKALHETIHYFLNERIIKQNKEIKHIVITNVYEWFIFDASEFEKYFFDNKNFRNNYIDWNTQKLLGNTTDWFYNEIAKPYVEQEIEKLNCVYINLLSFQDLKDLEDYKLINLYKLFSPEHLLKLPFANDYNKIDLGFYNELLYIFGLEEVKSSGKKIIQRVKEKNRKEGSLIENTIGNIEVRNRLKNIQNSEILGFTKDEKTFSIALELCITWLNRILFLKLLEAQLIKYHKGNSNFAFLNNKKIKDFDELDELFFEVLAKKYENRKRSVNEKFGNLPYLNSSLFEATDLEFDIVYISQLKDRLTLPLFSQSVLKQSEKFKQTKELNTLEYIFEFLNAYNFASDKKAEIQKDNKTIINAAVLGLIFEKINGYKDGSFYTPSFITTFISRDILKSTIVQKFKTNSQFKNLSNFEDLKDLIDYSNKDERNKANEIINSIKICDPAVGSGHFLVSLLNELVTIKSELKILQFKNGNRIKGILITNNNDELEIINEETGEQFEYYLNDKNQIISEIQELQEALFNEKQTLIEKCLFGVDINPKSVLICRLRLWIELLKNAFYKIPDSFENQQGLLELETLPNIDINIKTGNSLINFFDFNSNALKNGQLQKIQKFTKEYKTQVNLYKNTSDKLAKEKIVEHIKHIRNQFIDFASPNDKTYKILKEKEAELTKQFIFFSKEEETAWKIRHSELQKEVIELREKCENKTKQIYLNAFEWRFEFPEVLNENGKFEGFDAIVGNPPYFSISNDPKLKEVNEIYHVFKNTADIYTLFIERGLQILQTEGKLSFIVSNKWLRAAYGENLRAFLLKNTTIDKIIDFDGLKIFDEANVDTSIIVLTKLKKEKQIVEAVRLDNTFNLEKDSISGYFKKHKIELKDLDNGIWNFSSTNENLIKRKIEKFGLPIKEWEIKIKFGIKTGYNEAFIIDEETKNELISQDLKNEELIKPILRGKDVRMYFKEFKNLYIINSHNGIATQNIERINLKKNYPTIYKYLEHFLPQIEKRQDKGNHWSNLRNCAYWTDFDKEKIIYSEIVQSPQFYYDTEGYFPEATCFFIVGENLKYLTAMLNSKLLSWTFKNFYAGGGLGASGFRYKKVFLEKLPIVKPTNKNQEYTKKIESLVNKILAKKKADINADISNETNKIDNLVYELYQLTDEEIKIIEKW